MSRLAPGIRSLLAVFLLTLPLITPRIRGADEIEYFSYLRSLVFDHDLEFGNEYQHFYDRDPQGLAGFKATFLDRREKDTGYHINFGPLGSALLWSPAYLVTHGGVLLARILGATVPADGFSRPYEAAACYASAVYGLLGLLLIRHALCRFAGVSDAAATLATLGLWLGTPVVYYMTLAPGFSHASSLFAVSLTLWLWLRVRERAAAARGWAWVGLAGGLAGLVREQDALFLLAPGLDLLWLSRRDLGRAATRAAAMGVSAFVAFVPQLLAYRVLNGHFKPSGHVGQKMNYLSPHFFQVLFHPGHGLFFWSPLLLLAAVALGLEVARRRDLRGLLLGAALLFQVWINGAVESWTQAGAFGSRRFVGATLVFAWGLAPVMTALVRRCGSGRPWAAWALVAAFVWWNGSLMVQFGLRLMDRQGLEWPRVALNQVTEVPQRLGQATYLFFADRERLVKEGR